MTDDGGQTDSSRVRGGGRDDSSFVATKSKGLSLLLPCQENIFKLPKNSLPQRKFHRLAGKGNERHISRMRGGCIFLDFILWYLTKLRLRPSSSYQFRHPLSLQKLAEGAPTPIHLSLRKCHRQIAAIWTIYHSLQIRAWLDS